MPEFKDLTGMKFGYWYVMCRVEDGISKTGNHFTKFKCRRDCGTVKDVLASSLRNGRSRSCGCRAREVSRKVCQDNFTTHGDSKTRLYKIYCGMKKRCYDKKSSNYANYGARGITVCQEWLGNWESFKSWSIENGYTDTLSIDRIDVNGEYSPLNCRWVTRDVQANNRRNNRVVEFGNEVHTVVEWSKILDIPYKRLHKKLKNGATISDFIKNNNNLL